MFETEVFRITSEIGNKCYEYAETTRTEGIYPNTRYLTNVKPLYVGRLTKIVTGGYGDNGWRTDYFEDNNRKEHIINYSYEGNTCFREVKCLPVVIPFLESLSRNIVKKSYDYFNLSEDSPERMIIELDEDV